MKSPGKIAILAVFSFVGAALGANGISLQPLASLKFRVTEDFSFGAWGSMHSGPCLDQTERLLTPGSQLNLMVPFVEKGYNGWTAAPWFAIKLAKFHTIDLSGGGEVAVLSRTIDKDSLDAPDYLEVRPTGIISLNIPMGSFINCKFSNRFERRLFRAPTVAGTSISYFRYVSGITLATIPLTPKKMIPYAFYNGFSQKDSKHLAMAGAGISFSPAGGLSFDVAYRVRWVPSGRNESEQQVGIEAEYAFDFTK
jgi:hypothetical protein